MNLPIPPIEMRQLVGPTDEAAFNNETGDNVFELRDEHFESVLDFGCGCGRLARQMLMQRTPPTRYLGFDLHQGMIRWCNTNLASRASEFRFVHHDVYNVGFNPDRSKPALLPMPADSGSATLVTAISVFTHMVQEHAEHYLREIKRVLRKDGVLIVTFFIFEKRFFPMMQEFQNTLFINADDPTNATIFDRAWLQATLQAQGLQIVRAVPPAIRGFQWFFYVQHEAAAPGIEIPEDKAPFGRLPPPVPTSDPSKVGN